MQHNPHSTVRQAITERANTRATAQRIFIMVRASLPEQLGDDGALGVDPHLARRVPTRVRPVAQ